jgi:predicted ATPase
LFELRLVDRRRKTDVDVALSDVGFGISQLLPFVVQSLASQRQTISIEQPEVHVHPRLQADLGDLLIAGIQHPRRHRFIVETHSEHLILRLLRRIREAHDGSLPQGHPGLRPDDLSVLYLERGEGGSVVHQLRVDETGEFVDRWPKGFFEERAAELF